MSSWYLENDHLNFQISITWFGHLRVPIFKFENYLEYFRKKYLFKNTEYIHLIHFKIILNKNYLNFKK
jgi:hypothetical protein